MTSEKVYVSAEEYLAIYADKHYEWVDGEVIAMSPVLLIHELLVIYLKQLFTTYFALHPNMNGVVVGDPFTMNLPNIPSYRQPDIQVILGENTRNLTQKGMMGACDICIEVTSLGTTNIDYGEKFLEYEQGGVREYWIIDPIRHVARFNRLNDEGIYESQSVYKQSAYRTPLLPHFALKTDLLWITPLPDPIRILEFLRTLKDQ
jgi:Uma2 family endonuclease